MHFVFVYVRERSGREIEGWKVDGGAAVQCLQEGGCGEGKALPRVRGGERGRWESRSEDFLLLPVSLSLLPALGQGKLSSPRFDETVWFRIECSKFEK